MPTASEQISRRLLPLEGDDPLTREMESRAAVAMVLRIEEGETAVLLMTRAERKGDRWSGQVSMPGGHEEEEDGSLLVTAIRETREEIGVDLERGGHFLGRLPGIPARARGERLSMAVVPFVFARTEDAPLRLGAEAVEAFWFPLTRAASGALDSRVRRLHEGEEREFPSWCFEGREIWGLTYRMLNEFLRITG
jgi:8-oxo-dGTP pyrophosphatase MutT (NUDIX family)